MGQMKDQSNPEPNRKKKKDNKSETIQKRVIIINITISI